MAKKKWRKGEGDGGREGWREEGRRGREGCWSFEERTGWTGEIEGDFEEGERVTSSGRGFLTILGLLE